jgi:tetratricopeptide (TPR) repeat protein
MKGHSSGVGKQQRRTILPGMPLVQRMTEAALRHHRAGQLDEAERIYRQVLEIDANHADSLHLLGVMAYQGGDCERAVEMINKAIAINPKAASYHSNLGNALQALGKLQEAAEQYKLALAVKPDLAEIHVNLGNILQAQGELDGSIECYRRALVLKPDNAETYSNLGNTLQDQGRLDEALKCYERAVALKPDYAAAYYNLGCVLRASGNPDGALVQYRKALELQPDYAQARFAEALTQLLQGNFAAGWQNFELRWQTKDHHTPQRSYTQPLWAGETLNSGRLLIWGEQGIGDEIMFAGLLPDVVRSGVSCTLECDARLKPLFARSFPEIDVVSGGASDSADDFVAHLPSGSLPKLYRSSDGAFSKTTSPYLTADSVKQKQFRDRYGEGKQIIGLAWHTKNQKSGRNRSIDLSLFAPLFVHSDIRWVSLQYGDHDALEGQAKAADAPILIDRSVDQLSDIDSFAAQVAAMDIIITIDNTTAHLAGALGIPVWVLLPFEPDWRWLQKREDSLWYPTMHLFRQPNPGDWNSVVQRVNNAL